MLFDCNNFLISDDFGFTADFGLLQNDQPEDDSTLIVYSADLTPTLKNVHMMTVKTQPIYKFDKKLTEIHVDISKKLVVHDMGGEERVYVRTLKGLDKIPKLPCMTTETMHEEDVNGLDDLFFMLGILHYPTKPIYRRFHMSKPFCQWAVEPSFRPGEVQNIADEAKMNLQIWVNEQINDDMVDSSFNNCFPLLFKPKKSVIEFANKVIEGARVVIRIADFFFFCIW
ncbi:hypothetical protein ElyMa_005201800 [Elysia marginata]|uniref:Uncharacterized protein n=1 Tax=Elysia marginata TaxID=1093978 RepID=A0AAV4JVQ6_9GAST|nr:hypothetical protein ElyMa_005201800 [Elysia marginata]